MYSSDYVLVSHVIFSVLATLRKDNSSEWIELFGINVDVNDVLNINLIQTPLMTLLYNISKLKSTDQLQIQNILQFLLLLLYSSILEQNSISNTFSCGFNWVKAEINLKNLVDYGLPINLSFLISLDGCGECQTLQISGQENIQHNAQQFSKNSNKMIFHMKMKAFSLLIDNPFYMCMGYIFNTIQISAQPTKLKNQKL
ncbi:Hypothetical_protein [Hexamita inflata]|uniref:Hypothetical_protein n=1 Tax=Hexamita inflata TaxID=28002 RepID=A0AA86PTB2_9EUKA|nr:Hypothetical protein HINF_LOCUS25338 [Hexamita inflata]CAI9944573.1 Hypothetical protein HINF_LOCUS32218 [Hexamita inflata]